MDAIVDFGYNILNVLAVSYSKYAVFASAAFPFATEITFVANAINASLNVLNSQQGKPTMYWLHSLILVTITGFGGGIVTPLLLGKPSAIATNDIVFVISLVTWYCVHYLGFNKVLSLTPVKFLWTMLVAVYRTSSSCNMVHLAANTLTRGPYYPIPLLGPIILGTVGGSMSSFLPFDKGLTAISQGCPYPMQAAFIASVFYHLMVNDTNGFMGNGLRALIGTYSAAEVKVIVATFQFINLGSQVLFSPEANIFTPIHKLLYLVFQVQGPQTKFTKPGADIGWSLSSRIMLERTLEVLRIVTVILAFAAHIWLSAPPTSVDSNSAGLLPGQIIGTCQYLSKYSDCTPRYLTLEAIPVDQSTLTSKDAFDIAPYKLSIYEGQAGLALKDFRSRYWAQDICTSNVPVRSLDIAVKMSPAISTTYQAHCGGVTDASGYPFLNKRNKADLQSKICNTTTAMYAPIDEYDVHDWGKSCRTYAKVTSQGHIQLVLKNIENKQELLLWQNTDLTVCNSTQTSKLIINSSGASGVGALVVCSDDQKVEL